MNLPVADAHTAASSVGKRDLGLVICTSFVIGNIVGSGIFLLPASLASFGAISLFGWLLTSAGAIVLALVFARLSALVPETGGPYAYTRTGLGDFAGFLVAWGHWISVWVGNAAITVALIAYLAVFVPALGTPVAAAIAGLGCLWALTLVNIHGIRMAGRVQLVTTVIKLIPLVAIATLGLLYVDPQHFIPINRSGGSGFSAITASAALTLWAFLGLESATVPADHVKRPERTIPRATIIGTVVASLVYIFSTISIFGIIDPETLSSSSAPFADAAGAVWGGWARIAVAAGAVVACLGTLNGWIMLQGQIPMAAARDGLFPNAFNRLNRNGMPSVGIAISSVLVSILMLASFNKGLVGMFTFVILLATLAALVPYVFSAIAELMIYINQRERFRSERLWGHSFIAILGFLYSAWAIAGTGKDTVYWGFLLLIAGLPVYAWVRWRTSHPSSLASVSDTSPSQRLNGDAVVDLHADSAHFEFKGRSLFGNRSK